MISVLIILKYFVSIESLSEFTKPNDSSLKVVTDAGIE
jgi:hypothetical protein